MAPKAHDQLPPPVLHPTLEKYRARIEKAMKPAWLLQCRKAGRGFRFASHLGGNTPFMPADSEWPECDGCEEPLQFVWQIDFAQAGGEGAFVDLGLFQFFYCWDCFPLVGEDLGLTTRWYPDYDRRKARKVPQIDSPENEGGDHRRVVAPRVFRWVPFLSVPSVNANKLPVPERAMHKVVGDNDERLFDVYASTEEFHLNDREYCQVGGYARWIQFDDTPNCQVCCKPCEFVAAIGSEGTGMLWGDSGYWYFFACRRTEACYGLDSPSMMSQCY
jgi:uncharacterized protein YwqG